MTIRRNYSRFRSLLKARSRDQRFSVLAVNPLAAVVTLAVLAAGLAVLVIFADPYVREIDMSLPQWLEPVFEFFNWLGEGIVVYLLCVLLLLISLMRDLSEHPARLRAHDMTRAAASFYVLAAVSVAGIAAAILKFVIGRARPRLLDEQGHFAFDLFGPGASWASFPSGHTTTVMSCAAALALIFPRHRVAIILAGLVVSFSRIATGWHYPSDVLGGVALGALVSWLFARALAQRRIVFRFDAEGRVKPLHYIGRTFIPRGARSSRARS